MILLRPMKKYIYIYMKTKLTQSNDWMIRPWPCSASPFPPPMRCHTKRRLGIRGGLPAGNTKRYHPCRSARVQVGEREEEEEEKKEGESGLKGLIGRVGFINFFFYLFLLPHTPDVDTHEADPVAVHHGHFQRGAGPEPVEPYELDQ